MPMQKPRGFFLALEVLVEIINVKLPAGDSLRQGSDIQFHLCE